jgi:hypothetical protein
MQTEVYHILFPRQVKVSQVNQWVARASNFVSSDLGFIFYVPEEILSSRYLRSSETGIAIKSNRTCPGYIKEPNTAVIEGLERAVEAFESLMPPEGELVDTEPADVTTAPVEELQVQVPAAPAKKKSTKKASVPEMLTQMPVEISVPDVSRDDSDDSVLDTESN